MATKTNTAAFLAAVKDKAETALGLVSGKVVQSARRIVPVDTGALQDSIEARQKGLSVSIGSDLDYAGHVEAGTVEQPAQPYLQPALMENLAEAKRAFGGA